MSFSSGTFSLLYDWTTEAASPDPRIVAAEVQAEFVNVANGLTKAILKDGTQSVTADIPFGGNKLTGVGDPTSAQDAATKTYVDTKTWDTSSIVDSAITGIKINNGAVSLAKLSDLDQYRIIGRVSSGTGDPEALDPDDIGTILGEISATITLAVNVVTDTYDLGSTTASGYQLSTTGALRVQRPNSAADTDALFAGYRGTTLNAQIEANGDFQSATNSYGATSDRSVKREIADMHSTLDQLAALPMRRGKLNYEYARDGDNAPTREFVIADEVEAAGFGDLVKMNADGTAWVNYSGLYVKNIKATQELYAALRALERRVAALEGR